MAERSLQAEQMNALQRRRIVLALTIGLGVTLSAWIIIADTPIYGYSVWVAKGVTVLWFPAYFLAGMISGSLHNPPVSLVCLITFLMWFGVIYLVSAVIFPADSGS